MIRTIRFFFCVVLTLLTLSTLAVDLRADEGQSSRLSVDWVKNYLTIRSPTLAGGELKIHYLEAYCRPGSTDRKWGKTVIGHRTELISVDKKTGVIRLRDMLRDGVVVTHLITPGKDEVDFRLVAHNPTQTASLAHWAQPCIRVDKFTGCDPKQSRDLYPAYIRKCFIFLDDRLTRLPTRPWNTKARYTPGQVYCPAGVDRNDINPRPLSKLVPSSGLTGCFSADEKQIMAVAWDPYQELFQGVITCIHSDFRVAGLAAGETKKIHGKIYIVDADVDALVQRYRRDFSVTVPKEKVPRKKPAKKKS